MKMEKQLHPMMRAVNDCTTADKFVVYPLRFVFRARQPLYLAPGKSANILRGALGDILRKLACHPACSGAAACESRDECGYARIFEPRSDLLAAEGIRDLPRPFVLRAASIEGRSIIPGEAFEFTVNVFDLGGPTLSYLVLSLAQIGKEGLGPGRGRADLLRVEQLDQYGNAVRCIFDGATHTFAGSVNPLHLDLVPSDKPSEQVEITFQTPTELKRANGVAADLEFRTLYARAAERVDLLGRLYGLGPLGNRGDSHGRAANVRIVSQDIRWVEIERRSSKTGRRHPLGGFVGKIRYAGDLTLHLPILQAAQWTGVGRQTAFGKGSIAVSF